MIKKEYLARLSAIQKQNKDVPNGCVLAVKIHSDLCGVLRRIPSLLKGVDADSFKLAISQIEDDMEDLSLDNHRYTTVPQVLKLIDDVEKLYNSACRVRLCVDAHGPAKGETLILDAHFRLVICKPVSSSGNGIMIGKVKNSIKKLKETAGQDEKSGWNSKVFDLLGQVKSTETIVKQSDLADGCRLDSQPHAGDPGSVNIAIQAGPRSLAAVQMYQSCQPTDAVEAQSFAKTLCDALEISADLGKHVHIIDCRKPLPSYPEYWPTLPKPLKDMTDDVLQEVKVIGIKDSRVCPQFKTF